MGGSTNMLLSSSDIEYMIVSELKLEEDLIVDKLGEVETRRRFRVPKKGPAGRVRPDDAERPVNQDALLDQIKGRKRSATSPDVEMQRGGWRTPAPKLRHPSASPKTLYQRRRT